MRQAVMTAPHEITFRDIPPPTVELGQAAMRIVRIGICGSDIHVYHGKHPFTRYPVVQGHEFSARIESIGPGVEGLKIGSLVTAMPQVVCGQCRPCRRGDYHICDNLKVQGFQAPGCAQDVFVADAARIVSLPETLTPEQGVLIEPAAVAVHALRRAGNVSGKNVVVIGAGPIGNLVAQSAKAMGAKVLISDVSEQRLQIAAACGIPWRSNAKTESITRAARSAFGLQGFDVAFDCAGAETSLGSAIESIDKGGTIVVVAVFGHKPQVDLGLVQDRELNLIGTLMYQRRDYDCAIRWICSGAILTKPLEGRHFPFAEYKAAYEFIDANAERCMKVFIDL
jgi:L-iditol 2-dehydrogenase